MQTYVKTFAGCILLCTVGLSGCNSGSKNSSSEAPTSTGIPPKPPAKIPKPDTKPPKDRPKPEPRMPDFSCENSLVTLPHKTGNFFHQRQRDGVSCGLASINALHGREVVTKQTAQENLWKISNRPNTPKGLPWKTHLQLDSEQVQYLMREFAPQDPTQTDKKKQTAALIIRTEEGVKALHTFMNNSMSDFGFTCTFPKEFILLQSHYQYSHNKETGEFKCATGGHYVAVRKKKNKKWVVIDSLDNSQQENTVNEVLPLLPKAEEAEKEALCNNGPEYQLMFYVTEEECAAWKAEADAGTLFGSGIILGGQEDIPN